MTEKKRPWQEPVIRSLDDLSVAFGLCDTGGSQATTCATGNKFSNSQWCTSGSTAKAKCNTGSTK